ncbi:hypothetical protein [Enterobacter hormaechei]|uniref:hypothetical protein n=1 Tax=Enterobacter cloacae complex sp. 374A1 TaxID=3395832 RepID=UPI0037DCE1C8
MSEFKGTPGPWKYTIRNVNEMMTTFHGVVMGDTYIEIATRNEREDAQLISAAPELLEALQAVVMVADRQTDEFDMARAAIAKALGK